MAFSDDDYYFVDSNNVDERFPAEVSDYCLVDSTNEPSWFAELPLNLDDDMSTDNQEGEMVGLHGRIDNGLQQIFTQELGNTDEREEFFEAICAICDNGGTLLCCEGKCLRSFHATKADGVESNCDSLGYSDEQLNAMGNQIFMCKNCQLKQRQCFVCGKLGSSDESAGAEVFQCAAGTCVYFYHPNCVAKALRLSFGDNIKDLEREIAAGKPFTCPIHFCSVCLGHEHEPEPANKNDELMQFGVCRRCPKAYHRKCLPRMISFEDDEDKGILQRAWKGLMPHKTVIYCLKHEIDDALATPIRNHVKFPDME